MFKTGKWLDRKWLSTFIFVAFAAGLFLDLFFGTALDYWIHDSAVVYQARKEWKHTALVVMDDGIPINVTRRQSLPLYAKAIERLIDAGAKGAFLDARAPKEMEGVMPYAICLNPDGTVEWSDPVCTIANNQCQVSVSAAGQAPLKMKPEVFPYFRIAPYLPGQENLPDFLLYDWEALDSMPPQGLVVHDRLISKATPIVRWIEVNADHAAIALAALQDRSLLDQSLSSFRNELCDQNTPCRRVRFSKPLYQISSAPERLILPVSQLAACDESIAFETAKLAKDKVIILQMTGPTEATNVHITPMTTALMGPHLLTPGAQLIADAIETVLNEDHPQEPPIIVKYLIFSLMAFVSVWLGAYYPRSYLWLAGLIMTLILMEMCYLFPTLQLWPVTASMLVFLMGAGQTITMHLIFGFREGRLIRQYMPPQIHDLLISLKENESFRNSRQQAIVLMSDLASYTTVTGMLEEPSQLLMLMNDYLSETSFVLQEKYQGWLESYIGDMVCYYWPYKDTNAQTAFAKALQGTVELSQLQKRFFISVHERYQNKLDSEALKKIAQIIDAGIGLCAGEVVMGDLGPKNGVRKFGILGDPMNLTARIESLTRYFNTEIIVTRHFLDAAKTLNYRMRRLGRVCVKGRSVPEELYAVGLSDDVRFDESIIDAWEQWLWGLESEQPAAQTCPLIFSRDQATLLQWHARGLLTNGIWYLDGK